MKTYNHTNGSVTIIAIFAFIFIAATVYLTMQYMTLTTSNAEVVARLKVCNSTLYSLVDINTAQTTLCNGIINYTNNYCIPEGGEELQFMTYIDVIG